MEIIDKALTMNPDGFTKIATIGSGVDQYTVHGVHAPVIHELRKTKAWVNAELYVTERLLYPGEQGRIENRVYCLVIRGVTKG